MVFRRAHVSILSDIFCSSQLAMALKQSGLYTHLSAQQAAVAVAAAAAEAARASNGQAGQSSPSSTSRLPVNLSSLTPVPRSQLNLDIGGRGSSVEQERESMAARVKEAAMMQVKGSGVPCCLNAFNKIFL